MALSREVYYRCIWMVRDIERIRRLTDMKPGAHHEMQQGARPGAHLRKNGTQQDAENRAGGTLAAEDVDLASDAALAGEVTKGEDAALAGEAADEEDTILVNEMTIERACFEMKAIVAAMEAVPEAYRRGVFRNIVFKEQFEDTAHPNTWKKWKTVFINELARKLFLV